MNEPQEIHIPVPNSSSNNKRSRALWGFTFILLLLGTLAYGYWDFYLRYYQSTDDAYANGNLITINSVISGPVVAYFADDTDLVKQGQLLVQIDSTNYEIAYQAELAKLASIVLQVRQLYTNIEANIANQENKRSLLKKAQSDYESRASLHKRTPEAVSEEDYIHAKQDFLVAKFEFEQTEAQLESARAAAGNTLPQNHPLIEEQKSNIQNAFYHLQHCVIYAPQTGYIAQRAVVVGQWISPTTRLMTLIPPEQMWVEANFKETQLNNMRIGQAAEVWFDLYGSKVKFEGKVIGVSMGTGSIFSLIPPQNATGNWIKIVQRLPVRISLNKEKLKDYPIRIGISADVNVDISNQDLPRLAQSPPLKPVAYTPVFEVDLKEVNKIIDTLIQDNLKEKR